MKKRIIWGLLPERRFYEGNTRRGHCTRQGLVPIVNDKNIKELSSDFKISEQLSIRLLPDELRSICLNMDPSDPLFSADTNLSMSRTKWCLACTYEIPEEEDMEISEFYKEKRKNYEEGLDLMYSFIILSALKYSLNLYPVLIFDTKENTTAGSLRHKPDTPIIRINPYYCFWKAGVALSELEVLKISFPNFRQRYIKEKMPLNFLFATNVFEKSIVEKWIDIRILFLVICLEKIFLPDTYTELTHKLAVRTACFLSGDIEEEKICHDAMKEACRQRGKTVHGTSSKYSEEYKKELRKSNKLLMEYASAVILKFIENEELWNTLKDNERYKEFLKELDFGHRPSILS